MSRLFETIRVRNGIPDNIPFHAVRMNNSRKELLGCEDHIDLQAALIVPERCSAGRYKCRVVYSTEIHDVTFEPYAGRVIESLQVIKCDWIEYRHKYCDRDMIDQLYGLRGHCDDILIIKNNRVTDTSIGNIVFYDGSRWITSDTPLLKGTKREQLLSAGKITEAKIGATDIIGFKKSCIINAMLDIDEASVEIGKIII
ncbi:MAG: aminotransferase class IV [Spirochaetes bacterium]|nr:aminotransferase class IV [Spirochaetota bacterium]